MCCGSRHILNHPKRFLSPIDIGVNGSQSLLVWVLIAQKMRISKK